MSYKVCLFGVAAGVAIGDVFAQLAPMARELRSENRYNGVFLATSSDGDAAATGLRLLWLTATPPPRGAVAREFVTERWSGPELTTLVYDDQHGIYLWERLPAGGNAPSERILSDGPFVGVNRRVSLAVEYPQKGFSREALAAALKKPEGARSADEERALSEYDNAVTIGFRHAGVRARAPWCLGVLNASHAWALLDDEPALKPLPKNAASIFDYYVEPYFFSGVGLPERAY